MKRAAEVGVGLMCKPPRPGQSKTRLAAAIGDAAAATLSRAFLADTAATLRRAAASSALLTKAYYRPVDAGTEIAAVIGGDWPLAFCDAGDLGASMLEALGDLLSLAPAGAMIVGSDLPTLPESHIRAAAAHLRAADANTVVIGPSFDGGYYLIGVRSLAAAAPLLAPMAWSTRNVLAETRQRARRHGLRLVEIDCWHDVDEVGDLALIGRDAAAPASATRAALERLGGLNADG